MTAILGTTFKVKKSVSFVNTQAQRFQLFIPDWWSASWFLSPFQSRFAFSWKATVLSFITPRFLQQLTCRDENITVWNQVQLHRRLWLGGLESRVEDAWQSLLKALLGFLFLRLFFFFFTVCPLWNEVKYFARPLKCSKKQRMLMNHANYIRSRKCTKELCHLLPPPLGHISWFVCCVRAGLCSTAYLCPSRCHLQPEEVIVHLVLADKSPHVLWSFLPAGQQ